MIFPLQTPTLPQHLSWLFIRCKHLSPVSPSALAHTLHTFTRVPAHRQVLFEQLHLPSLWAPRHNVRYYLCSYSMCHTEGWSLQMPLHRNRIALVTKSSQCRSCRSGFISVYSVSLHSQGFLLLLQLQNKHSETVFKIATVQTPGF